MTGIPPIRAHLSSLPPTTSRTRLIYLLRERYRTEQVYGLTVRRAQRPA